MDSAIAPISFFLLLLICTTSAAGTVGINYGRIADDLPTPQSAVQLLKSTGLTRIKLYDTNHDVLTALAGSGISVVVALPNEQLADAAADQAFTDKWVSSEISAYLPETKIDAIAVGNEVFVDPNNTTNHLVGAMENVHASLVKQNLDSSIKISSPFALSALQTSYPPSSGSFKTDLAAPVIKPMLQFIRDSDSYVMVNAYPFFAYSSNADKIPIDYALLQAGNPGAVDPNTGLKYESLFDAQIDAVYAALSALSFDDLRVVVTETGWPSKGDVEELGAGETNAAAYNDNLVRRVLTKSGTPLRPNVDVDVFLFALFNENQKSGATSERNYGLFYPNEKKVYDVALTLKDARKNSGGELSTRKAGKVLFPATAMKGQTWCVANKGADENKLREALNYACGEGRADCRSIQDGATCFNPTSLEAHASYAFNSYYQKNKRRSGTCVFGGAAHVVTQSPSYGKCEFPITSN